VLWAACRSDETAADGGASGGVFTTAFIACYKPGQSRRDHMAAIAALIKGQGYPQVPQLLCSDALMGKAFGDF
jgi:hypothetical protein